MTITDQIQQSVQKLSPALQEEALDFINYLVAKAERDTIHQEKIYWNEFSLNSAMRGLEQQDLPHYTLADLKIVF